MVQVALMLGPTEYAALMVLALARSQAVIGPLARPARLPRAAARLRRPRPAARAGALHLRHHGAPRRDRRDHRRRRPLRGGETLFVASRIGGAKEEIRPTARLDEHGRLSRSWKAWLRGAAFGFPIGALRRRQRGPDHALPTRRKSAFASTPRSSATAPSRAWPARKPPTTRPPPGARSALALGLLTSATAAVMLAGFQQYGFRPGPLLFTRTPSSSGGMIASLYIGNMMLAEGLTHGRHLGAAADHPCKLWLYAGILCFATLGAYTLNNNAVDIASCSDHRPGRTSDAHPQHSRRRACSG